MKITLSKLAAFAIICCTVAMHGCSKQELEQMTQPASSNNQLISETRTTGGAKSTSGGITYGSDSELYRREVWENVVDVSVDAFGNGSQSDVENDLLEFEQRLLADPVEEGTLALDEALYYLETLLNLRYGGQAPFVEFAGAERVNYTLDIHEHDEIANSTLEFAHAAELYNKMDDFVKLESGSESSGLVAADVQIFKNDDNSFTIAVFKVYCTIIPSVNEEFDPIDSEGPRRASFNGYCNSGSAGGPQGAREEYTMRLRGFALIHNPSLYHTGLTPPVIISWDDTNPATGQEYKDTQDIFYGASAGTCIYSGDLNKQLGNYINWRDSYHPGKDPYGPSVGGWTYNFNPSGQQPNIKHVHWFASQWSKQVGRVNVANP